MANFIGRLGVLLGLDSAEFQKGLAQASRQLDTFVDKARTSAAVGATAFAAMTYAAMKMADEIVDTAKANDIAVDSVLKLRNALAMSGGEAENAGKLLSTFTANIDKAAQGSFETQKTLKSLGVSLQDLRTMSIDQLLTKSLDGLAKMEDPLTRNAHAMELFGKAAKGVDFASLNQEIANGAGVTDTQAKAIEDAAAAYDAIAQAGRDFSVMLATELGPSIKATADYLGGMKEVISGAGTIFRTVFETVAVLGANVAFVFKGIADEIAHTIQNAKLLAKLDIKGAIAANEAYDAKRNMARLELDQFERRILGGGGRGEGFDDPRRLDRPTSKPSGAPKRTVKPGVDKEAEAEKKKRLDLFLKGFAEEQRQIEENNRLLAEQDTMYQKGNASMMERQRIAGVQIDRDKEMLELVFKGRNMRGEDLQLAQELMEIEWKKKDAIEAINANQTLDQAARAAALERENALTEKAIELAKQRNALTKKAREGTVAEGFFQAMEEAARNAATAFQTGQQAFQTVVGNMNSAIDTFVRTGKFAFKDFARSVIQDLIAIQMKAQAIALINMGLKAMGFGISLPGKAVGGPVSGGSPYIVGERGPELFVPSNSGAIVPNNRLADSMGGNQPSVVYNGPYIASMNAIDTQSGVQFLARNRDAVWAANQSAGRSMPQSR